MRSALFAMVLVLGTAAAGCGITVSSTRLDGWPASVPPPRAPHAVAFVTDPPAAPFAVVSLLEARNGLSRATSDAMIAALRDGAERAGCDALELAKFAPNPKGFGTVDAYCLVFTGGPPGAYSRAP